MPIKGKFLGKCRESSQRPTPKIILKIIRNLEST